MIIRQAKKEDREEIQYLYEELTNSSNVDVSEDRIESIFEGKNNFLLVAVNEGQIKGTAFITLCLDPMYKYQPYAVIENLIVHPLHQGHGIGGKIIEYIDQLCLDHDCSKVMLLSSSSRKSAHEFFVKKGYCSGFKSGLVKYRRNMGAGNA